jgi:alpha-galactosidase
MEEETARLLMNRDVLAVNQDSLGVPGRRVRQMGSAEVWAKPLADGSVAVALINRGSSPREVTVTAGEIGLLDTPKLVRDLWAQEDVGDFTVAFTRKVEAHETVLLKVRP